MLRYYINVSTQIGQLAANLVFVNQIKYNFDLKKDTGEVRNRALSNNAKTTGINADDCQIDD